MMIILMATVDPVFYFVAKPVCELLVYPIEEDAECQQGVVGPVGEIEG